MLPAHNRWNVFKCWVPNCPNSSQNPKQFVSLPTDPKMRETWLALTGKKWSDIQDHVYYCEDHFVPPYYKEKHPYDVSLMTKPLYKMPEKICRTCMSIIQSEQLFYVLSFQFPSDVPPNEYHLLSSHQREPLSQMLTFCIPELNLQTNPPPLVCYKCFYNIWMFFVFKIKCNENEKTLRGNLDLAEYGRLVLCRTCPQNYGVSLFNLTEQSSIGTLLTKLFLNRYPPDIVPLRVCLKCWNILYKLDYFYQKCLQIENNLQHIFLSGTLPEPYSDQRLNVTAPNYSPVTNIEANISLVNSNYPSSSKTTREMPSSTLNNETSFKRIKLQNFKDVPPPPYREQSLNNPNLHEPRAESVIKCVVNYDKGNTSGGICTDIGKNVNVEQNRTEKPEAPSEYDRLLLKKRSQLTQSLSKILQLKQSNLEVTTLPEESNKNIVSPQEAKRLQLTQSLSKILQLKKSNLEGTTLPEESNKNIVPPREAKRLQLTQSLSKILQLKKSNLEVTNLPEESNRYIVPPQEVKGTKEDLVLECNELSTAEAKNNLRNVRKPTKNAIESVDGQELPRYEPRVEKSNEIWWPTKNSTKNTDKKEAKDQVVKKGPFMTKEKIALAEIMLKLCKPLYENWTPGEYFIIPEKTWQKVADEFAKKTGRICSPITVSKVWDKLTARVKQISNDLNTLCMDDSLDQLVLNCIQTKAHNKKTEKPNVEVIANTNENINSTTSKMITGECESPRKKHSLANAETPSVKVTANTSKNIIKSTTKMITGEWDSPRKKHSLANAEKPSVKVTANTSKNIIKSTTKMTAGEQESSRKNQSPGNSSKSRNMRQPWTKAEKLELAVLMKQEYEKMQKEETLSKAPWRDILQRIAPKWSKNCTVDRLHSAWQTMRVSAVIHEKNGQDVIDDEVWDLLQLHSAVQKSLPKNSGNTKRENSIDTVAIASTSTATSKPTKVVVEALSSDFESSESSEKKEQGPKKTKRGRTERGRVVGFQKISEENQLELFKLIKKEMLELHKTQPTVNHSWYKVLKNVSKTGFRGHHSFSLLYGRWRLMWAEALRHEKSGKLTIVDDKILRLLRRLSFMSSNKPVIKEKKKTFSPKRVTGKRKVVEFENDDDNNSDTESHLKEDKFRMTLISTIKSYGKAIFEVHSGDENSVWKQVKATMSTKGYSDVPLRRMQNRWQYWLTRAKEAKMGKKTVTKADQIIIDFMREVDNETKEAEEETSDTEENDETEENEPMESDTDDNFDEIVDRMNESSNTSLNGEEQAEEEPKDIKPEMPQLSYDYISWDELQKGFKKPVIVSEVIDLSSDDEEPNKVLEDLLSSTVNEKQELRSEIIEIDDGEE